MDQRSDTHARGLPGLAAIVLVLGGCWHAFQTVNAAGDVGPDATAAQDGFGLGAQDAGPGAGDAGLDAATTDATADAGLDAAPTDAAPTDACGDGGLTLCAGRCVEAWRDPANCGVCGNACPANETCYAGTCSGCASWQALCPDQECHNLRFDPANCGACGYACPGDTNCLGGQCLARSTGQTCTVDSDCGPPGVCLTDAEGFSGGYCTYSCAPYSGTCGLATSNVYCLLYVNPSDAMGWYCAALCTRNSDCRNGYVCAAAHCARDCNSNPGLVCGAYVCSSDGSCSLGCNMPTDCSAGSTCDATLHCLCSAATDCGPGHVCLDGACISQ